MFWFTISPKVLWTHKDFELLWTTKFYFSTEIDTLVSGLYEVFSVICIKKWNRIMSKIKKLKKKFPSFLPYQLFGRPWSKKCLLLGIPSYQLLEVSWQTDGAAHSTTFSVQDNPYVLAMSSSNKRSQHNLHPNMTYWFNTDHAFHSFCIQNRPHDQIQWSCTYV